MTDPIRALILTLAVFWHLLAFAAGGVYALLAYRSIFLGGYDRGWTRILRAADWQLWASGLLVIGLNLWVVGASYLDNPKLQAKLVVVGVWFCSTVLLRRFGRARQPMGRAVFVTAAAVNLSCWAFGAFLGVGRALSQTGVSLPQWLCGFAITLALVAVATWRLSAKFAEERHLAPANRS